MVRSQNFGKMVKNFKKFSRGVIMAEFELKESKWPKYAFLMFSLYFSVKMPIHGLFCKLIVQCPLPTTFRTKNKIFSTPWTTRQISKLVSMSASPWIFWKWSWIFSKYSGILGWDRVNYSSEFPRYNLYYEISNSCYTLGIGQKIWERGDFLKNLRTITASTDNSWPTIFN